MELRIDETVCFNRLQRENMDAIAKIHIEEIGQRLMDGQNMTLDVSDAAVDVLADRGYDHRYGARPLKRVLNRSILNPLSTLVLEGSLRDGDTARVRTRGEALKTKEVVSFISSDPADSDDRNDVVIFRSHLESMKKDGPEEEDQWDDDEFLLEDGIHDHR